MTYVPFAFAPFVILLAGLVWLAVDEINRRARVRQRIERRLAESLIDPQHVVYRRYET